MATYYEKRGRKYVPVLEKDVWSGDVWPAGFHLVVCKPGVRTTRYNIEPDDSAFIAAQMIHSEKLASLLIKASAAEINPEPITDEQKKAWEHMRKAYGGGPFFVRYESAIFIVRKFLEYLKNENNFLQNPDD